MNDALLRPLGAPRELARICSCKRRPLEGGSSREALSNLEENEVHAVFSEGACNTPQTVKGLGFAAIDRRQLLQSF